MAKADEMVAPPSSEVSMVELQKVGQSQGKTLPQILDELGHVAEGVYTAREVARLATRLGIEMPISTAVAAVLDGRISAGQAVEQLMARDPKEEVA